MVDCLIFNNEKEENFKTKSKQLKKQNLNIMEKLQSSKKNRTEFIFALISIIFGIIVLIILLLVFFVHPSEKTVGERFVIDELTFYTPIYEFHFKPITLLVIFSFLFLVFGVESLYSRLIEMDMIIKRLFFMFFFLTTFIFTYETLQNFLMWTSFYILNQGKMSLDELSHQINSAMLSPVNFLFISKLFSLFLFSSLYGLYFFNRIMNPSGNNKK
jgi:hypothetical protein